MTHFTSTTRRIAFSALAAFAMAAALPQTAMAANGQEAGLWKVNIAKSKVGSDTSRLVIERVKPTDGSGGAFLVINRGNAYLATPASSSGGVQPVDHNAWKGMKLTKIGTGARAIDECGSTCRFGQVSNRLTVTFRNTGAETMDSVLALNR